MANRFLASSDALGCNYPYSSSFTFCLDIGMGLTPPSGKKDTEEIWKEATMIK